jgi:tripartite-type tricarboxylate transporter receptor subunit TctC
LLLFYPVENFGGLSMERSAVIVCLAAAASQFFSLPAVAQDYPTRPIRIIVTTSPGGISDVFVRALSEPLHQRLGQPIVVENRAGGFMILGARACAEANPDGYTLCVMPGEPLTYNQFTQKSLPYDPVKSFEPVTNFFFLTQALGVSTKLPVKNLDDLAAYSRSKAGTLSYSAPSSSLVFFMENWKKKTAADMVRVPFKGGGDTVTNMLSGTTPVGFLGLGNFMSYLRAGSIRTILVDAEKRLPMMPDTATLAEIGFSREHTRAFFGLLAPAGTPHPITERVRKEIIAVASDPSFRQRHFADRGLEPVLNTPAEFRAHLVADREKSRRIVEASGLGAK